MKFKRLFSCLALSSLLAVGVGVGLGARNEVKEAKAVDNIRFNALLSSSVTSFWYNNSAITCFKGSDSYVVQLSQDSDIGTSVTLGNTSYDLWTGTIDVDQVTYNASGILRMKSDKSETWNGNWGIWLYNLKTTKSDNTFIVNSGNQGDNVSLYGVYWKLVTYTGNATYSSATDGTKTAKLVQNGSSVANPEDAPAGLSFAGWYSDYTLTTPWSGTVTSDLTLYAKYAAETRTYNKYYYYNGSAQGSVGTDTPEVGASYTPAAPANPLNSKYYFAGWYYWDSEDITKWPVGTIAEVESGDAVSIYAVYLHYQSTADKYIYYVSSDTNATPNYIYSYGGESQFGTWPGTTISSISGLENLERGTISFDGKARNIYKIPYNSLASDTHIIINYVDNENDKNNSQTGDMPLSHGTSYWFDAGGAIRYFTDGIDAFNFAKEVDRVRNLVTAHGSILNYSVCGISDEDAATLCGSYNLLSANARGLVDNSLTYTYNKDDLPNEINVSFYDIMEYLSSRSGVALNGHSSRTVLSPLAVSENNTTLIAVITVSIVCLAAIGGYFLLRRRKED